MELEILLQIAGSSLRLATPLLLACLAPSPAHAQSGPIVELARHTIAPGDSPFGLSIADYYLSNPIARASAIMASLSATHADEEKATGTDG